MGSLGRATSTVFDFCPRPAMKDLNVPKSNVCFKQIRSKHNSNTLLSLLRIFLKQTLTKSILPYISILCREPFITGARCSSSGLLVSRLKEMGASIKNKQKAENVLQILKM